MASLLSTLMRGQFTLLNPLLQALDTQKARKLQEGLGRLQQRAVSGRVHFQEEPFELFEASWAWPKTQEPAYALLYLHGGAYTAGELEYSKGFGGAMADYFQAAVLCVAYRLAPEHPFPAALEDALMAYQKALEHFAPEKIAFVGESAGGGLCYALAQKCRDDKIPLPAAILTASPWCDLNMQRDVDEACRLDPLLSCDGLRYSAQQYAGTYDRKNPMISPLFGDLKGLPDSLMFVGTDEVLMEDAVLMADRLNSAGSPCELVVKEGMWHAYVLYGVPESKEAMQQMHEFLQERIHVHP